MTSDEWTLLSNVIHGYDGANLLVDTRSHIQQYSALPPKIRSKLSSAFQIVKQFYTTMQPFVERSPHFHLLSPNARRAILRHNADTAGSFNSIFLMRECKALENPAFLDACQAIYGPNIFPYLTRFVNRFETNGTLVKVMFLIFAFSSNCSVVNFISREDLNDCCESTSLLHVQNILVTMFWKYLIYQYGFQGAVQRLDSLIKHILNILGSDNDDMKGNHSQMIDNLVEETTKLWSNTDAPNTNRELIGSVQVQSQH